MTLCSRLTLWGPLILGSSLFVSAPCQAADPLTVTRVVDSDTLQLSNGETVRLIGLDVPTKLEKEAAEFTQRIIGINHKVRLEYDAQKKDKHGRTLAYVFIDTDSKIDEIGKYPFWVFFVDHKGYKSRFINAEIIQSGYAQVMTPALTAAGQAVPSNVKYQELFVKLDKEARENRRGLWK